LLKYVYKSDLSNKTRRQKCTYFYLFISCIKKWDCNHLHAFIQSPVCSGFYQHFSLSTGLHLNVFSPPPLIAGWCSSWNRWELTQRSLTDVCAIGSVYDELGALAELLFREQTQTNKKGIACRYPFYRLTTWAVFLMLTAMTIHRKYTMHGLHRFQQVTMS